MGTVLKELENGRIVKSGHTIYFLPKGHLTTEELEEVLNEMNALELQDAFDIMESDEDDIGC